MPQNEHDYYRHPEVIKRMLEYGGVPLWITSNLDIGYPEGYGDLKESGNLAEAASNMSADYIVRYGTEVPTKYESLRKWQLGKALDSHADVFRSRADEKNLVCLLDFERCSFHDRGLNYRDMVGTFQDLDPFLWSVLSVYHDLGLNTKQLMVLATANGYQIGFKVPKFYQDGRMTEGYIALQSIGHVSDSERGKNHNLTEKRNRVVTDDEAWANEGWGKLAELIFHEAKARAPGFGNETPIVFGDYNVDDRNPTTISADISFIGDPLFMRDDRFPFSLHSKHITEPWKCDPVTAYFTPKQIAIPRMIPCNGQDIGLKGVFENRRNFHNAANLASVITCDLPAKDWEVAQAVEIYKGTDVAAAHAYFDDWSKCTYEFDEDRHGWPGMPNDLKEVVYHPNPSILNPGNIRALVHHNHYHRGFHPMSTAGLIAGRIEFNKNYMEENFYRYDALKRAIGWTRPFFTEIAIGAADWRNTVNW